MTVSKAEKPVSKLLLARAWPPRSPLCPPACRWLDYFVTHTRFVWPT